MFTLHYDMWTFSSFIYKSITPLICAVLKTEIDAQACGTDSSIDKTSFGHKITARKRDSDIIVR